VQDLLFYPEGGRSYSGELKPVKTGLLQSALTAECPNLVFVPVAIAYDLVLEDRILSRQQVKKQQRPFTREVAEMIRYLAGYRSRAIVSFGAPIPASDYNAESPADLRALAATIRERIGSLYKVLPTAVVASAMRPSITAPELEARIDRLLDTLAAREANLGVHSSREAMATGIDPLASRGIIVYERGRFRIRERQVLRYYARTIEHLLL
jgi:glycerol-3-phosphate O-acyltransferase